MLSPSILTIIERLPSSLSPSLNLNNWYWNVSIFAITKRTSQRLSPSPNLNVKAWFGSCQKPPGSNIVILDSFSVYLIWILISNLWWLNFQLEALGYQSFVSEVKVSATNVVFGPTTAEFLPKNPRRTALANSSTNLQFHPWPTSFWRHLSNFQNVYCCSQLECNMSGYQFLRATFRPQMLILNWPRRNATAAIYQNINSSSFKSGLWHGLARRPTSFHYFCIFQIKLPVCAVSSTVAPTYQPTDL